MSGITPSFTGSETLLPCPFCGCDGQKFKDFWDSGTIDCFGCKDCAISFECADEWNRREPQSVTVAQRPTEPDLMPAVAQTLRFFKAKIEERGGWSPVCQDRFDEAHSAVSPATCGTAA